MKMSSSFGRNSWRITLLFPVSLLYFYHTSAQVCSDPNAQVYGIDANGLIYPITVSNASVGTAINTSLSGASSANALGYNSTNNTFYYFNANYNKKDPTKTQFVSYNPLNNSYIQLATPPITNTVVTGCVSADGKGYYCLDINANFYYYNIASDTWITITSAFKDQTGADLTATMKNLASGDMAFDGNGNLWFIISNSTNYGLYKLNGPVPTSAVTSLTLQQIIATTTPTPDNSIIAGISFNATGQIFLSTSGNHLYILNNDLTTSQLGTFTTSGVGADLTSCNYPQTVLPVHFIDFNVSSTGNNSMLCQWTVAQQVGSRVYEVEQSTDGTKWVKLGSLRSTQQVGIERYTFSYNGIKGSNAFYRIREVDDDGTYYFSKVITLIRNTPGELSLWPNPSKDKIQIYNPFSTVLKALIIDPSGEKYGEYLLQPGLNQVYIQALPKGTYILLVQQKTGNKYLKFFRQ